MIRAPDFQPQPISSRATGLAATRRGLQLGFSVDEGTEVAFPSLEALAEFVRRAFLSGGGGDGAGGIVPPGGGPPQGPEDGGGEGSDRTDVDLGSLIHYAAPLMAFAEKHLVASGTLSEDGDTAGPVEALALPMGRVATPDALALVDSLIGAELVRRSTNTGNLAAFDAWAVATHRYFAQARALSIPVARLSGLPLPRNYWRWGYRVDHFEDPLDVLASLPIPPVVAQSKGASDSEGATESWESVKDLFYGLLANPALFSQTAYQNERMVLFLFAGAVQVGRGPLPHRTMMREFYDWLIPQMPKFAYTPKIEAALRAIGRRV